MSIRDEPQTTPRQIVSADATAALDESALVVDLDGTLLVGDTLVEQLVWSASRRPVTLFLRLLRWGLRPTRLGLKQMLARTSADLPIDRLHFRSEVIALIEAARANGTPVILATATHQEVAESIATHLGLFDAVLGSDAATNLKSQAKLNAIRQHLGERRFQYVGDSRDDLPLWSASVPAIVLGGGRLAARVRATRQRAPVVIPRRPVRWRDWVRALRPHQWVKNGLVLVPMLASHRWREAPVAAATFITFLIACMAASAIYLVNDALDVHSDRGHVSKRARPIASGRIPIPHALGAACFLAIAALAACILEAPERRGVVVALLIVYWAANLAYSLRLKRFLALDIVVLALMYLWRIGVGSAATGIVVSDWLAAFSVFLFLGLAAAKRCTDLEKARPAEPYARSGRGYTAEDLSMMRMVGVTSSLVSVLVLSLYIRESAQTGLYRRPAFLWIVVAVTLYWLLRLWFLSARGRLQHDPVAFALTDRATHAVLLLVAIAVLLAT